MKILLKEEQNTKLVEFILNREMPKKFPWWKKLHVEEFRRMNIRPKLVKLNGKTKREVTRAIIRTLKKYKGKIFTITSDNGSEFADHKIIAKKLGFPKAKKSTACHVDTNDIKRGNAKNVPITNFLRRVLFIF
jgi:hypothetical protein